MGRFNYYVKGVNEIIKELDKLEDLFNVDEIAKDCATETYNRTQRPIHDAPGGTPKDTGELIRSARMSGAGVGRYVVGYVKEYAPHVEYGHRLVAWGHDTGRFVPGQKFLEKNLKITRKELKEKLRELAKGG